MTHDPRAGGFLRAVPLTLLALGMGSVLLRGAGQQTEAELRTATGTRRVALLKDQATAELHEAPQRALEHAQEAVALARKLGDSEGAADNLKIIALAHNELGRPAEALRFLDEARAAFEAAGSWGKVAACWGERSQILARRAEYKAAANAANAGLEIATRMGDQTAIASAHYRVGKVAVSVKDHATAIEHLEKSLRAAEAAGAGEQAIKALIGLGVVSSQIKDLETGLQYFLQALTRAEARGDTSNVAFCLGNIGLVYKNLGRYEEALQALNRSLAIEEKLGRHEGVAETLTNIANTYVEQQDYARALESQKRALAIKEGLGNRHSIAYSLDGIGELYLQRSELDAALPYVEKAMAIYEEVGDRRGIAGCLANLGKILHRRGRLADSRKSLERGLAIAGQLKDDRLVRDLQWDLAELDAREGKNAQAYGRLRTYVEIHNRVVGEQTQQRVAELQARYDAEKRQRQLVLLEKDNRIKELEVGRARLRVRALLVGGALLVVLTLVLFRNYLHLLAFWKQRTRVGHYRLLDELGSGGMGIVYRASDLLDRGKVVALKVIREELSGDEIHRRRLLNEGALIDQIQHPHIVRVVERGDSGGRLYVAMELLRGQTLGSRIAGADRLSLSDCLEITGQLLAALARIHDKGILHRDVKPANVMLTGQPGDRPFVKLLDFGLAKSRSVTALTEAGMFVGTLHYLAPETISRQAYTAASDTYALGVVLFEMLTGEKPFPAELPIDLIRQILEKEPLPPSRFRPEVPAEVDQLVQSMLSRNPDGRPPVEDARQTIDGLLATLPAEPSHADRRSV